MSRANTPVNRLSYKCALHRASLELQLIRVPSERNTFYEYNGINRTRVAEKAPVR